MTATATRPALARSTPPAPALPLLALSEVALAALSLVTVLALRRVFIGTDWFPELALQVVAAHGLVVVLRRRGLGLPATFGIGTVVAVTVVAWLHAGDLTTFGIPGGAAIDSLVTQVSDAMAVFGDVKAPTEPLDGFLVATSAAIWLGAMLADWAAFRVDAPLEATLPAGSLFVLAAILGADVDRILLTGMFVAAALAFVLFRRADRLGHTATWVGERRSTGPRTLVLVGVALALVSVSVAALLGPRLPGARSEAIVSLTDIGDTGPGTRVTISPLVDIRSRLVDQADVEVFTVRSPVRDYWRLTSLDQFDGRIWSSNGSYGKAEGDLDDGVAVASERISFEQTFSITSLAQIWLPAAYEPQSISSATPVRYDEVSGTLIVDTEIPTSDNTSYRVASALPQHLPENLAAASRLVPDDIAETYLEMPDDFPEPVAALARDITAGSASTYESALRLQNFFREEFTYDLDVGSGHSKDAIEQFVLVLRRGYCEQFAGSFAAMARSLGIPARVAVGFTPGTSEAVDPTLYRVRGENAHAWPEVFIGEYGWVKFEPTPGRGAPFTEQYTGVPEQQVTAGGDGATATTTASPPSTDLADVPPTTGPSRPIQDPDDLGAATGDVDDEPEPSPWPMRIVVALGAIVGLVLAYLLLVLTVTILRRGRRRRAATDVGAQVALAWDDSMRAVRRAGVPVRAAETQQEIARRVGNRIPSLERPLRTLAITVQDTTYAPGAPDPAVGETALALAAEIEAAAESTMSGSDRFRTRFHPRSLLDR